MKAICRNFSGFQELFLIVQSRPGMLKWWPVWNDEVVLHGLITKFFRGHRGTYCMNQIQNMTSSWYSFSCLIKIRQQFPPPCRTFLIPYLIYFFHWLKAITALKKGAQLLKYGRRGKPKFCPFKLSNVCNFTIRLLLTLFFLRPWSLSLI